MSPYRCWLNSGGCSSKQLQLTLRTTCIWESYIQDKLEALGGEGQGVTVLAGQSSWGGGVCRGGDPRTVGWQRCLSRMLCSVLHQESWLRFAFCSLDAWEAGLMLQHASSQAWRAADSCLLLFWAEVCWSLVGCTGRTDAVSCGTSPQLSESSQAVAVWGVALLGAEEQRGSPSAWRRCRSGSCWPAFLPSPGWGGRGAACVGAGPPRQQGSAERVTSVSCWWRSPVLGERGV